MIALRSSIRKALKVVGFLSIFILISYHLTNIFLPKDGVFFSALARNQSFYALPENSVDIIFFGASSFRRGLNPLIMWNAYGITGYNRSSGGQLLI